MVVDDEPDIAAFISDALRMEGYDVVTAASGREALARVDDLTPALILLDLRMPDMTGWEFAQVYRERFGPDGVAPIVLMSAANDMPAQTAEVQAVAALPKPFELDDLINTVERFTTPSA